MRCARHPHPPGSVGVCPSCLREKLLALIDGGDRRKSDSLPPPLIFPRSVSPYICRGSDSSHHHRHHLHHQLFYSTPQIGPTFEREEPRKEKKSRFSLLSSLFGTSRSEDIERGPRASAAPIASSNWFSPFRKKKSRLFSFEDEIIGGRRSHPVRDRGMSPERGDRHSTENSFTSESSPGWRKSVSETSVSAPAPAPAPGRRGSRQGRNVSGFAFCLSPLVRPSPNRNQRSESGFSSELRRANRHHLATAASHCANRSRKLADFGRYP